SLSRLLTPRVATCPLVCSLFPPAFPLVPSLFSSYRDHRHLHSFPTRRSSDLGAGADPVGLRGRLLPRVLAPPGGLPRAGTRGRRDRKSTRLNSSHVASSYAVFCLKKKKELIGVTS